MLIKLSITHWSNINSYDFAYLWSQILPVILQIILGLMLMALQTANIYYQLNGFSLYI